MEQARLQDTEYDDLYNLLMISGKGREFLDEHVRRAARQDTDRLLDAFGRLEQYVRENYGVEVPTPEETGSLGERLGAVGTRLETLSASWQNDAAPGWIADVLEEVAAMSAIGVAAIRDLDDPPLAPTRPAENILALTPEMRVDDAVPGRRAGDLVGEEAEEMADPMRETQELIAARESPAANTEEADEEPIHTAEVLETPDEVPQEPTEEALDPPVAAAVTPESAVDDETPSGEQTAASDDPETELSEDEIAKLFD